MNERSNVIFVLALSGLALVCIVGSVVLEALGRPIPTILPTLAAACAGAVSGFIQQKPFDGLVNAVASAVAKEVGKELRAALGELAARGGVTATVQPNVQSPMR